MRFAAEMLSLLLAGCACSAAAHGHDHADTGKTLGSLFHSSEHGSLFHTDEHEIGSLFDMDEHKRGSNFALPHLEFGDEAEIDDVSRAKAAKEEEERIMERGTQIFTGMFDAFLHRKNATEQELDCLVSNFEDVAYVGYAKSNKLVATFHTMGESSVAGVGILMPKLALTLNALMDLPQKAIENCMSPEARMAFITAVAHMSNLTYVAGKITANGADVLDEMADAVAAFRDELFTEFGHHLGRAGRKVLLSNSTEPSLPEGPPTDDQIVNVSAGLIQGFFGEGFVLDISAKHKVSTFPLKKMMAYFHSKRNDDDDTSQMDPLEGKQLRIHVDLHSCVHKNLDFFQSVLYGAWYIFARSATNIMEMAEMPGLLASAMRELPDALKKCNVTEEKLRMLEDSVLTLKKMHVNIQAPSVHASYNETIDELHKAAAHWDDMDWFSFGEDLGGMLLEMAVTGFPQLYAVDASGALARLPTQLRASGAQAAVGIAARVLMVAMSSLPVLLAVARWRAAGTRASGQSEELVSRGAE